MSLYEMTVSKSMMSYMFAYGYVIGLVICFKVLLDVDP